MQVRTGTWLLALTVVMAGCSSAEEPPSSLPALPSTSAEPGPSTVSGVPPEATAETPQAASAFAKHFLSVVDAAFKSADPKVILDLSAAGCGGCESLAASVADMAGKRHRQLGGDYVDVQAATPAVTNDDALVDISYRRTAGTVVNERGVVVRSEMAVEQTSAQMRLVRRESGWIVQGYRIVEE